MSGDNGFITCLSKNRIHRNWSRAELARRAGLSQPEVSRLESGARTPTIRHIQGLAEAFSASQKKLQTGPTTYNEWAALLIDLGEEARKEARKINRRQP